MVLGLLQSLVWESIFLLGGMSLQLSLSLLWCGWFSKEIWHGTFHTFACYSVSSLAWFMSMQETSFVTIGQRVLAHPLKYVLVYIVAFMTCDCIFFLVWVSCLCRTRFHYGHPDVFDRLFHLTRGGISKASRVINLSEDIFAGFTFWLLSCLCLCAYMRSTADFILMMFVN
jgi:hypothetical protein